MSGNNHKKLNHCIYCDAELASSEIYCPECGKLNSWLKSGTEEIKKKEDKFERKCPACGSLIVAKKLQQCPICDALLSKIPEELKNSTQEPVGYIFDWDKSKKLRPVMNKENWNFKEGIQVFELTILLYFMFLSTIILFMWQTDPELKVNIITIILQLIPYSIYGLYPLIYIINNKNKFKKLGFSSDLRLNLFAILIGIFGGITLYVFNFLSTFIFNSLVSSGFQGFIIYNENTINLQIILKSSGAWIFLYLLLIITSVLSVEITFRGVLHNCLVDKFNKTKYDQLYLILIVALIYAGIESLFMNFIDIFVSLYFFMVNFITFIILGMLFEINRNIYNTVIAHALFNILIFITLIYF